MKQKWNLDFTNIEYLLSGRSQQQKAYSILTNHQVLIKLKLFDPMLVGTIPIGIDVENSDLDIICCFTNKDEFKKLITENFKDKKDFTIREKQDLNVSTVVVNFVLEDFPIEIFGQNIPTKDQLAYRHLLVEYKLLKENGEKFRQEIIDLKNQGCKTEPAFTKALGLIGDPYIELLKCGDPED
ncbi:MAG: DUF4269 domain-containing protein [Leptospiraceae bacterium]|nr:DUF4269 domain-containing protein [Leptospiraceae bacterium]MCK6381244.1 DUF4269 domain-containing protein [Leptospiraceae bacterium]